MAWAQSGLSYSSSSVLFSSSSKTAVIVRNVSVSASQSRSTRRKNHLRTKILKTLTKPPQSSTLSLHHESLEDPESLITKILETVREEEVSMSFNGDAVECFGDFDAKEEMGSRDFQVLESVEKGVIGADKMITTRSVVELVLYFVGLFVVQAVCTVGFLMWSSSSDVVNKSGNGEGEAEIGVSGDGMASERKKEGFWFGEEGLRRVLGGERGGVCVDESRMREQIAEIRAMAREARESEVKRLSANGTLSSKKAIGIDGSEMVDKSGVSGMKTNVEIEVDQRLSKLEKELRLLEEKSSTLVNYSVKDMDGKVSEFKEANVKDEKVVFKKKLKFKSKSAKLRNKAKGFGNANDHNTINGRGKSGGKASSYSVGSNARDSLNLPSQKLKVDSLSNDKPQDITVKEEESNQLAEDGFIRPLARSLKNGETNSHVSVDRSSSFQDPGTKADEEGNSLIKGIGRTTENSKSKSIT